MSLNPAARINSIEVKLNPSELSLLDQIRGGLGRSPFLRDLMHREARSHGKPPSPPKEALQCRAIRPASRGAGFQMQRRQV